MDMSLNAAPLRGTVTIPGSKSHTIRALLIATLASGVSRLRAPLDSADTLSCLRCCQMFGAQFEDRGDHWQITGTGGALSLPPDIVDVGNSGTSMNFLLGTASLLDGYTVLSGDDQIKRRPVQPLLDALRQLNVAAHTLARNGCPPVVVRGPLRGGSTVVRGRVSQYLSSLLVTCPLCPQDSEIQAIDLGEKPYVRMTLHWLDHQGIDYQQENLEHFRVRGGQAYQPFDTHSPADFSSATFFICAAALPDSDIVLKGLDFTDPQGDKEVVTLLRALGADIHHTDEGLHVRGRQLDGGEIDLGDMPDALPAMAVVGCFASGTVQIRNVAHARLKETDRIAVMCHELRALGADIDEHEDGMTIRPARLRGATVDSRHDHRVAMALALAGTAASGTTIVQHADAVHVTFPQFFDLLRQLGAGVRLV